MYIRQSKNLNISLTEVHFVGLYYTIPFNVILPSAFVLSFFLSSFLLLSRFQIIYLCEFLSLPYVTYFRVARLANLITRVIFGEVYKQWMEAIACPKTSARNYHSTLCNSTKRADICLQVANSASHSEGHKNHMSFRRLTWGFHAFSYYLQANAKSMS